MHTNFNSDIISLTDEQRENMRILIKAYRDLIALHIDNMEGTPAQKGNFLSNMLVNIIGFLLAPCIMGTDGEQAKINEIKNGLQKWFDTYKQQVAENELPESERYGRN